MSKKSIVVTKVCEGHDNPIAELVQVACKFDSEITLESDNRKINAKSIMGIMAFNPSDGMTVDIVTKGDDEQEALVAIENFLVCDNEHEEENSMRKKNNSKTVKQAVKPVEVKKEETVAQPVSEPKADVKAEVEKAVEKTAEKVEKAVEKTTEKAAEVKADVKDTVKKTTAKAAKAAKTAKEAKTAKKEPVKPEIIVQYQDREVDTAAVEERVKAQFVAEGHKAGFIRKLNIYIKPEEYSAYYVINDKFSGRVDLF